MKRLLVFGVVLLACTSAWAQTLEECQRAAEQNYPLIRQYDLIEKTTELTVANIQKGWLPQIAASAQATYQSDVMSWPEQMGTMIKSMGIDLKGLKKDQYKVGIDVQQTLFDGGAISSQKAIVRGQGRVQSAQNEVNLYNIRKRVNEMYFALLMLDHHIRLNTDLQDLLASNEKKLASMVKGGTAALSDLQSVKAERLNAVQKAAELESQKHMLQAMLTAFCGIDVKNPTKPALDDGLGAAPAASTGESGAASFASMGESGAALRPEMHLFDAQLKLIDAQEQALNAALKPKLGLFAQGYYGYPGFNMFDDMLNHNWSLNAMVGARVTWNIGALYTRKNDKAKMELQRQQTESNREVFLFNNRLEQIQQNESISRYRRLMADDEEIISLRAAVRKAAESKLSHGIIDVVGLVREINQENAARVQQSMHEIEMLKQIYDNKFTTNR